MMGRRTAWLLAATFWALFGVASGIQVWISMRTHGHSVPVLIGYHMAIWMGWLGPTAIIVYLSRRWPVVPPRVTHILVHGVACGVISVAHGFYWLGLLMWIRPYDRMMPAEVEITKSLLQCLPMQWTFYCLVLGCSLAFDYHQRDRNRALELAQLETRLSEARLHALELQIQPHFLFNTMNAISSLVRGRRNDEAVSMITGLSDILRYTLDHAGQSQVALADELAAVRRYLEIQQLRFEDRLSFRIEASAEALRAAVPTLSLQPLVENAVRHGIAAHRERGVIEVRAWREHDRLRIEVFNTGRLEHPVVHGIGLSNTIARLQHLHGGAKHFDLRADDDGVRASVNIPWRESV